MGYVGVPAWVAFTDEYATFYEASVAAVATKTTQHETTDDEFGRMFVGLKQIHDAATAHGIAVETWPTQHQWAKRLGRSQPTISRWMALLTLHADVRGMIVEGTMSKGAAVELRSLSSVAQAQTAHQLEDERRETNSTTVPQRRAREVVRARRQGPIQWVNSTPPVAVEELLLPVLAQYDPPTAFGIVAHGRRAFLIVQHGRSAELLEGIPIKELHRLCSFAPLC